MIKKCSMSMKEYDKKMKHEEKLGEKKGKKMEMHKMHEKLENKKDHKKENNTLKDRLLSKSTHEKKAKITSNKKGY